MSQIKNFILATFDNKGSLRQKGLREIDRRKFIGTYVEACEELQVEYEEFYPAKNPAVKGPFTSHPNYRDDIFWEKRLAELVSTRRTRVEGNQLGSDVTRYFEMQQVEG